MKPELAAHLLALNRQFYADFADPFAETRLPRQPGLERILPYIPAACTLLDVGCGNGRLALWLEAHEREVAYTGVDFSTALLVHARQTVAGLEHVKPTFWEADITQPGWSSLLPGKTFQVVIMLAVLHHIPGQERRQALCREMANLVVPGGVFILTTWQFLSSPRMRRKIVPWARAGISPDEVEPNDYLLDWKRGGLGYRYCHLVDEAALAKLAVSAGFSILEMFYADGKEGNLNLYAVCKRER